jgi:hypothetical protein
MTPPLRKKVSQFTSADKSQGQAFPRFCNTFSLLSDKLDEISTMPSHMASAKSQEVLGKGGPGVLPWRGLGCPQFLFLFPKEVC